MLPVLPCLPDLRRHIRLLSERVILHMRSLSMVEVPNSVNLKSYAIADFNCSWRILVR